MVTQFQNDDESVLNYAFIVAERFEEQSKHVLDRKRSRSSQRLSQFLIILHAIMASESHSSINATLKLEHEGTYGGKTSPSSFNLT